MKNKLISALVLVAFAFTQTVVFAESVEDKYTQISPTHAPGSGEYVHGQGYGKLLIRVLLFGSVGQQGVHYVPEGTDLLFAMLYAGGYSETTKLNDITIRRKGVQDLIEVDLEDLMEAGEKVPRLQDGDIVNVPYNWRKDITTIGIITGFVSAMTGFTLSLIAISK